MTRSAHYPVKYIWIPGWYFLKCMDSLGHQEIDRGKMALDEDDWFDIGWTNLRQYRLLLDSIFGDYGSC